MKTLLLSFAAFFSPTSFAELPIVGPWYHQHEEQQGTSHIPHSLIEIRNDGTMVWELQFPGSSQKQVVVFSVAMTETTLQTLAILSKTKCGVQFEVQASPINYWITNDVLHLEETLEVTRATPEQVSLFKGIQEGCN